MNMSLAPDYICPCSRSFTSDTAYNRHYLRCPMRPRSRKKACEACVRAKSRCDRATPSCGRCVIKSLPCDYSQVTWPTGSRETSQLALGPVLGQSMPALVDTYGMIGVGLPDNLGGIPSQLPSMSLETPAGPGHDSGIENLFSESEIDTGSAYGSTPASHQLSRIRLTKSPITTEQELSTIDDIFKQVFDGMSCGKDRLPLIHSLQAQLAHRTDMLNTVASISQFYVTRTADSEEVVLDMINQEVQHIYSKRETLSRVEFLSAFQAVVIYSAMRIYSINHYVNDLVDTIAMTFTQYILRHSMHCLEPEKNVQPADWSKWIQDESTRRNFFAIHALNVVSNSRKGFSTTMCHAFPEVPLPYPTHVWEATTPEAWAFHHRSWDTYCGKALLGVDLIDWANGKRTGREDHINAWLTTIGSFGQSILTSAKAQLSASFAIRPN